MVEPLKKCYVQEVNGLNDMQKIVGGDIEATYPFQEPVAVVYNANGKNLGLAYNRPLLDESGLPYDIVCGTFFLAGLGVEDFVSLTDDQIQRYKKLYDNMQIVTIKAQEADMLFGWGSKLTDPRSYDEQGKPIVKNTSKKKGTHSHER